MKLLTPEKDGQLVLDFDDVVQRSMTVVRDGEKTWPPPPVQVSAAPAGRSRRGPRSPSPPKAPPRRRSRSSRVVGIGRRCCSCSPRSRPTELIQHFTVFALAVVVGYYVIGHVHHALHTPLMSVTNAISGIIVVGALLQIGHDEPVVTALAFVAILLASINVFGGFAVTRRMLGMFSRRLSTMTATTAASRGLHRRRPAVHPEPGRAVQARDARRPATPSASPAWRSRWSPPSCWPSRSISAVGIGAAGRRHGHRCGDRPLARRQVEMTGMPELIAILHSFVGLAAVLVGWNGYLEVEANAGEQTEVPEQPARHPPRRGRHRRLHRRGHLHRLDRGVPQALGADQVQPLMLPARTRSTSARSSPSPSSPCCSSSSRTCSAAHRGHRARARAGLAPRGLDRRRRHAGRRVDAQQLLRLGGGRRRASCWATTC